MGFFSEVRGKIDTEWVFADGNYISSSAFKWSSAWRREQVKVLRGPHYEDIQLIRYKKSYSMGIKQTINGTICRMSYVFSLGPLFLDRIKVW